jgi:hypothetical protein
MSQFQRSAAKLLTRDEARCAAVNMASRSFYEGVMTNHERWTLLYFRKFFTAQASSQYLSIVCAK